MRIVNSRSGVRANVSEDVFRALPSEWVPAEGDPLASSEKSRDVEKSHEASEKPKASEQAAAGAPAGNASRAEWAAYAESLGIETGDMKVADIKKAVAR